MKASTLCIGSIIMVVRLDFRLSMVLAAVVPMVG